MHAAPGRPSSQQLSLCSAVGARRLALRPGPHESWPTVRGRRSKTWHRFATPTRGRRLQAQATSERGAELCQTCKRSDKEVRQCDGAVWRACQSEPLPAQQRPPERCPPCRQADSAGLLTGQRRTVRGAPGRFFLMGSSRRLDDGRQAIRWVAESRADQGGPGSAPWPKTPAGLPRSVAPDGAVNCPEGEIAEQPSRGSSSRDRRAATGR